MGMNTVIHGKDSSGNPEHVGVSKNALKSREVGLSGVAHNRYRSAVATSHGGAADTTNAVTWTSAAGVLEVTIAVPLTASCTGVLVTVGATDGDQGKSWLDDTGTTAQTINYELVPAGTYKTFIRTTAITRVDMKALGATTAVGVSAVGDAL